MIPWFHSNYWWLSWIGTVNLFAEARPVVHEETGPSETNLFSGKCIIDPKQAPAKQIRPVARLHKILKFRFLTEINNEVAVAKKPIA